ncbi:lysophospholipid acyltransferase family protein [Microvirga thermotolerans]|uniref:1-acyl-sn-glycerol-3-phosphate acyltransferase n=1 Tax=Microvirga thermotolerans TaxID=2651334 RepID=A0A5P9JYA2_9HYPH|nr:lysophospholipid acyltransferase family protein [Microvirga thermotolerans]QFU14924.1 1-acyl-sn-glycerol-3-phosphate acyltransferase [Microvirga thermotolerans]
MSRLGVLLRLGLLGLVALVLIPLQMLALRWNRPVLHLAPMWFHRVLLRLFNVRVTERGRPPGSAPTLVVANHVSWLDIPVIGSLHPLSFIAKSEIEGWPVVGLLARLQRSVFIDRQRRKATAEVNDALAHRLVKGETIVLFAEGTTSDGNRLLPFRSSLVGAAQTALMHDTVEQVFLQPLAIAYIRRDGLPVTRRERPFIAWYGDMELAPHLRTFLEAHPLDVTVTWGEPIPFNGNRKEATAAAEAAVRSALKAA